MDTTFFTLCNGKVLFLHLNNGYEVISYFVAHQLSVSFTSFQNNLSCFPCRCYRLFLRLFVFVMDRFKRQHSLSSVWIRHPKYFTALDLYPQLTVNTEKMCITIRIKAQIMKVYTSLHVSVNIEKRYFLSLFINAYNIKTDK